MPATSTRIVRAAFTTAMVFGGAVVLCACMRSIAPTSGPADVVITRDQFGTTVGVKVGQTIAIPWSNSDNWRIDFASPPLELLKPDTPSSGWRFRAVAAGETDVVLTLITTGDAAPPRLSVTIQVTK